LIAYTPRALQQINDLRRHYEDHARIEAIRTLDAALAEAERKIERNPGSGLAAPRPYPQLARPGRRWIKSGRYWITYNIDGALSIVGVFYETANIPNRV
jgi:plasmid stabilization system protein ParE